MTKRDRILRNWWDEHEIRAIHSFYSLKPVFPIATG